MDLLDPQSVRAAVEKVLARFGRIDVLCNLAGAFRMGAPVHETSAEDWDFLLDVNARTIVHTAKAVVPRIVERMGAYVADPRRCVAPQDLAEVIVFLASDAARALHGAALPVSGLS